MVVCERSTMRLDAAMGVLFLLLLSVLLLLPVVEVAAEICLRDVEGVGEATLDEFAEALVIFVFCITALLLLCNVRVVGNACCKMNINYQIHFFHNKNRIRKTRII